MGRRGYGYKKRYYGNSGNYRRNNRGSAGGGAAALLIILLIGYMKNIATFVLAINAFVIVYYTVRYKISSAYNLESLNTYKKRFLFSSFIPLGSIVYSILFSIPDIKNIAFSNVILALFAYILTVIGIRIFNWIKPKVHNKINEQNNELNQRSINEYFEEIFTTSQQSTYEGKLNDNENSNVDISSNEYEFNIPDKTDAELKGEYGELIIAGVLSKLPIHYKVMNNVLLEYEPNIYSQMDHLVISSFGIFVIESKNYSGYIFGKAQDNDWSQVLYGKNNEKKTFHMPNPIKQNISHIKALQKVLTKFPIFYHNIVVFTGNCKIERTEGSTPVVHVMKLLETIRDLSQIQYLNNEQVTEIFSIINNLNKPEMISDHINRVNKFKTS
jgi:hypothetical protein